MQLISIATVMVVFICRASAEPLYHPQETFDSYHGVPIHHHYPIKALHGYDNYHKYGGIGKKAHLLTNYDHGAKGMFD